MDAFETRSASMALRLPWVVARCRAVCPSAARMSRWAPVRSGSGATAPEAEPTAAEAATASNQRGRLCAETKKEGGRTGGCERGDHRGGRLGIRADGSVVAWRHLRHWIRLVRVGPTATMRIDGPGFKLGFSRVN